MKEQNVARGIAILGVLAIHLVEVNSAAGVRHEDSIVDSFSFILPMFFFLAGYTYRGGRKSIKLDYKNKVWSMFKYFFKYFTIIWALYSVEVLIKQEYTVIECLKAYLTEFFIIPRTVLQELLPGIYVSTTFHDIFIVTWFVWVFMESMLLLIPLERLTRKSVRDEVIVILVTCLAAFLIYLPNWHLPFHMQIVPTITAVMLIAHLLCRIKIYDKIVAMKKPLGLIIMLVAFAVGFFVLYFVSVGYLSWGALQIQYDPATDQNVVVTSVPIWLMAMAGMILTPLPFTYFCRGIGKIPVVGDFLSYFGINSMDTMLLHVFIAFTLCNILPLKCARQLIGVSDITTSDMVKCYITFFITIVLCYLWPKLKMKLMKWNMNRKAKPKAANG
ncbi:MAG: acyltransferase [Eubacterium sp.]|nr:acyltransferase [Eubacterium sp.]